VLRHRGAVVVLALRSLDLGQLLLHVAQLLFQHADARIGRRRRRRLFRRRESGCRKRDQRRAGQETGNANPMHEYPV